jgi:LysM repeat protein
MPIASIKYRFVSSALPKQFTTCLKPSSAPYPSTYAPVPTNLAPGSTRYCFTYYTVQSLDNCHTIASNWTITVPEFKQWNPELNSDCSNLIAGEAYCVYAERESKFVSCNIDLLNRVRSTLTVTNGAGANTTTSGTITPTTTSTSIVSSTSTTSTVTASVPPVPSNAAPGAVSPCYKWYSVVSGDYCDLIGRNEGCTVAQLEQWNPSLGSNCVAQLGVAYCVRA